MTKTALQRLAFRIAEDVAQMIDDSFRMDQQFSTEDIYRVVYRSLPFDEDDVAIDVAEPQIQPSSPTLLSKLRESVQADKGTPIKVVIEAACAAIQERDMLRQKIAHGCTDALCEVCDG